MPKLAKDSQKPNAGESCKQKKAMQRSDKKKKRTEQQARDTNGMGRWKRTGTRARTQVVEDLRFGRRFGQATIQRFRCRADHVWRVLSL